MSAVVEAAGADDVASLLRYAAGNGLTVATQAGGHGASGNTDGAILLRLTDFDELHVDPATGRARAGAGVRWGAVQRAAAAHGLTGLAGSSPIVSVTGYTLGGGLSWFGRAHGWAADSVTALDVVTADGGSRRVTAESDAELFWALRGGGGDYAVVTAVEFALHPAPSVYGGRMVWPADRASAVLDTFREVTASAGKGLTLWYGLASFPGADPLVAVDVTYLGPAAEAEELLRPFGKPTIADTRRAMTPADLGEITADPIEPSAGTSRSLLLTSLDEAESALLAQPLAPVFGVQLRHTGGALAGPSSTPFGPLTEPYYIYCFGAPIPATRAGLDELTTRLGKSVSPRKPYFALSPGDTAADAFDPPTLDRLRAVKQRLDPGGTLRANYPITAGA